MKYRNKRNGAVLIICMIFLCVFATLAISMASISGINVQLSNNQHKVNSAFAAAESGIDCGKYLVIAKTLPHLIKTNKNTITVAQANEVWSTLCTKVRATNIAGNTIPAAKRFPTTGSVGDELVVPAISCGDSQTSFTIRFFRYDSDPYKIILEATGTCGEVTKKIRIDTKITKESSVLNYAIASRGRMWITGNSTIYGPIYSSWDRTDISPFNLTSDSRIESARDAAGNPIYPGQINTILTLEQILNAGDFQLETLDAEGQPMFDVDGNRIYGSDDEIQGYHEGINYGKTNTNMPGMDISDYNTQEYYNTVMGAGGGGDIYYSGSASNYTDNLDALGSTCGTKYRYERFPHNAGSYTTGSGLQVKRYIYKNQTFTDKRLPNDKNALFIDCTFNGILYVDCGTTTSSYNNVRFDGCTFNGVIVTDTPQTLKWRQNCLYFTGSATFAKDLGNPNNVEEATILAPHFNVNLGNTNPVQSDNNVLEGAIIGGIVDVRGNAQVKGTIISMADTTMYSSGYVTNIGATLDDGGSETTSEGDVGVISIDPDEEKMLPDGVMSPIIIKPLQGTYSEVL